MYDLIIEVLEIIKRECNGYPDNEYDENDEPTSCLKCPFFTDKYEGCFFKSFNDAKIPEEWDISSLREKLEKENRL